MFFFDCNTSYGILGECLRPIYSIKSLLEAMKSAGIQKAVVSSFDTAIVSGNERLAGDINGIDNLYGIWTLLPSHTHEIPEPGKILKIMKRNQIIGWRLSPGQANYLPKVFVLRDWLEAACNNNVPLFVNTAHGTSLEALADILERFPELTVILTYKNAWPSDRLLRPFISGFAKVYLDMTYWFIDGYIESFI
jgi:hypothetical protein